MTDAITAIPLTRIGGEPDTLANHAGKVLLIVNVASKCGLTPQYEGLEALYRAKQAEGLEVLAFPANNFNGQEPGADDEIASFCKTSYDVTFPLYAKISVKGDDIHPLYAGLTALKPEATGDGPMRARLKGYGIATGGPGEVVWNFEKFLVGRDGQVIDRFAPDIDAADPRLVTAVDKALSAD
ncbi:glutathione peroxidase [Caulobacter sp. FWC2]|jgi:glutathione peroxidase|uniref:glutathione peroxidase n=1 Tax=Caulobacter sp. FWC2 TaxID=69664 RepID=UPI000C15D90F|nr:glutathione peroxidase [Caulobacter sp. FWC2]PIB89869.1 glutathione peroxidase [Caulobacter sp. FWC2]PIB90068.1 glutathione peroxidase [Caulobacter sp. FWC2]